MNYENLYNGLTKEAISPILIGAGLGSGINYVREKDPKERLRAAIRGAFIGGGIGVGAELVKGVAMGIKASKEMNKAFKNYG